MTLEIEAAEKRFDGHRAVAGVTASLAAGEFFVVLGPSGCGKSTLLRLVAGLERLDAGAIRLEGRAVSAPGVHVAPEARAVGVVFQSYALWPHMSVLDNVAFPAEAAGAGRAAARRAAARHLEVVDLGPLAARPPAELSGGQRQRVALARCLAQGARTILMDEPLANLDPHLRGRMEAEIARFHREAGVATLYITHDQREAMALADRIAVMEAGRFLQIAPPEEIHDRPRRRRWPASSAAPRCWMRRFRAARPASARCARPWPRRSADGPARVVIRPGDVALGTGQPARIEAAFYRGGGWEALARVDGLAEPLPVAATGPLRAADQVQVELTGGWALPG